MRQYFVFTIESFWSLFLHRVQIEALNGAEYLAWLLDELDLGALADEFDVNLPNTDARTLTLEAFYKAVRKALPSTALDPDPTAL